jgi:chaperone modulatory protein CbpM
MITLDAVIVSIAGLERADVEHWISQDLVRPTGQVGEWQFGAIDVARLRLIRELRHELQLQEEALPVVLRLMDQLYDARRQLRRMRGAVERTASPELRQALLAALLASDAE